MVKDPAILAYRRIETLVNKTVAKSSAKMKAIEAEGVERTSSSSMSKKLTKSDKSSKNSTKDKIKRKRNIEKIQKGERKVACDKMSTTAFKDKSRSSRKCSKAKISPSAPQRKKDKKAPYKASANAKVNPVRSSKQSMRNCSKSRSIAIFPSTGTMYSSTPSTRQSDISLCSSKNTVVKDKKFENQSRNTRRSSSKKTNDSSCNSSLGSKRRSGVGTRSRTRSTSGKPSTKSGKRGRKIYYSQDGNERLEIIEVKKAKKEKNASSNKTRPTPKAQIMKARPMSALRDPDEIYCCMENGQLDPLASTMSFSRSPHPNYWTERNNECKTLKCPSNNQVTTPKKVPYTALSEPKLTQFNSQLVIIDGNERYEMNIGGLVVEEFLEKLNINGIEFRV